MTRFQGPIYECFKLGKLLLNYVVWMRYLKAVALVLTLVVISICAMALTRHILDIRVVGMVSVPLGERVIDINLSIGSGVVEDVVSLGTLEIPSNGSIQIKPSLIDQLGNFSIVLDGVLVLESGENLYRIPMPCLLSIGEACYRILMLIPGYDVPMPIRGGLYNGTMVLRWRAGGSGSFHLRISVTYVDEGWGVSIDAVGVKPSTTDN